MTETCTIVPLEIKPSVLTNGSKNYRLLLIYIIEKAPITLNYVLQTIAHCPYWTFAVHLYFNIAQSFMNGQSSFSTQNILFSIGIPRFLAGLFYRCKRPKIRQLDELHPVCTQPAGAESEGTAVQRVSLLRECSRRDGRRGTAGVVRRDAVWDLYGDTGRIPGEAHSYRRAQQSLLMWVKTLQ